jgi:DNA-binding transcriptional regulator YhcF (GntR family)
MSIAAVQHIAGITSLTPTAKLVALQLATFHNHSTGQCNPSPNSLAMFTGLSLAQVKRAIVDLLHMGIIIRGETSFAFPRSKPPAPTHHIPSDFWPSEATIQGLVEAYPNHHFDMENAVNEFITYYQRAGRTASDPNSAFRRNISRLLDRRRAGPVTFDNNPDGNQQGSVRSLLSGGRESGKRNDVRGNAVVRDGK